MPAEFGEDEIEANIQLDASQYIPFPLEEIYIDFQIVQKTSKVDANTQDVMIVASRKENVDLRREVLQEAGLKTAIVDVEAYALENAVRFFSQESLKQAANAQIASHKSDGSLTAVVDIGADITTLYVLRDDKVIFTREQTFGGEQLTTAIAEFYDLPKDRAELAKRSGDLSEDYPVDVLAPFQQAAAEQIGQALQFFFSSDHYAGGRQSQLERIILMGGGAMIAGLDNVIAERLNIPATIGNPFAQMSNITRVNRHSLLRDAPLFGVACGLALRSFD
jgi:type IV pilus assembly protein PilM